MINQADTTCTLLQVNLTTSEAGMDNVLPKEDSKLGIEQKWHTRKLSTDKLDLT